jgi:predicted secreted acid phosphatase
MAFIKYATAKIIASYENEVALLESNPELEKVLNTFKVIKLDPSRYMYLRNRAISSLETWGCNRNADGFPRIELQENHHTFINSRVSVDHKDNIIVGVVVDSYFVPPKVEVKDDMIIRSGDYVENILALDKKVLESYKPDGKNSLLDLIVNGIVTDTSMGAIVGYSICSVPTCMNVAHTESEYCEHIKSKKGSVIKLASGIDVQIFEICRQVTFFEDSIIVPLAYGGLAGGEGADPNAKFLEKVATTPLKTYIVYRDRFYSDFSKRAQIEERPQVLMPEKKVLRKEFKDEDIEYTKQQLKKNLEEELSKTIVVEKEEVSDVVDYLIELLKKGTEFNEALKLAWEHFKGLKEKTAQEKKKEVIVVDIDGTLFDVSHRLKYIEGPQKDWKRFFSEEEVSKDKPYPSVVEFVNTLKEGTGLPVVVLTGRPETLRELTERQLEEAGVNYDELIMKPKERSFEKAVSFKKDVLRNYVPVYFVDDDYNNLTVVKKEFPDAKVYLADNGKIEEFSVEEKVGSWKRISFKKEGKWIRKLLQRS